MPSIPMRKPADIAGVIRALREEQGLSQSELAQRLNFSRDYMIDMESGDSNLYISRLFRTLHELGITMRLEFDDASA